jgi:hypothetical protein
MSSLGFKSYAFNKVMFSLGANLAIAIYHNSENVAEGVTHANL